MTTDAPVWAAAPGQAAVLYDGDEVLGGGRIERPEPAEPEPPAAGRHSESPVGPDPVLAPA